MAAGDEIRVVIVDDHLLVREGIKRMLATSPNMTVVGEARDGLEGISVIKTARPDVALVDISMPRLDGVDTTTEIIAAGGPTRVLILTMYSDEHYARRCLRAGASGFLWKGSGLEELLHAIREVEAGRRYIPERLGSSATDIEVGPPTALDELTMREFQVLQLLARGMTNREIADDLDIGVKTVDTHRGKVLKKLNLRNNSDLTRYAIRHGLLEE